METRKQVRLLVVDDEREYFENIVHCAELCRHQVLVEARFAHSEAEARELIRSWAPSAVLVDVHMSGDTGYRLIRGCSESAIPVVATGSTRSREIERDALKSGASAFFAHSDDPEELETVLHTVAQMACQEYTLH